MILLSNLDLLSLAGNRRESCGNQNRKFRTEILKKRREGTEEPFSDGVVSELGEQSFCIQVAPDSIRSAGAAPAWIPFRYMSSQTPL
ncbi:MAG: hypothetical protein DCC46_04540 [Armatimonadetes bacterium]|nr:MAG: hypothetical protein DCC46_04540 [Armatimonadota bacterium]